MWGETIVPCGGAAANCLGLTTQNPVRAVYLTSGPNRRLHFGSLTVELRHAPRWQLAAPHRKAGDVIRALAWLGPEEVEDSLEAVLSKLSEEDRDELSAARAIMPIWMAEPVSARLSAWLRRGYQHLSAGDRRDALEVAERSSSQKGASS